MSKIIVCLSCKHDTDATTGEKTFTKVWNVDDVESIRKHQEENPTHILIKGYQGN